MVGNILIRRESRVRGRKQRLRPRRKSHRRWVGLASNPGTLSSQGGFSTTGLLRFVVCIVWLSLGTPRRKLPFMLWRKHICRGQAAGS
jgi:hypothetical protein